MATAMDIQISCLVLLYLEPTLFFEVFESISIMLIIFSLSQESEERDNLYECLVQQENVSVDDMRQDNISYQWQAGAISNFEYLSYLNRWVN